MGAALAQRRARHRAPARRPALQRRGGHEGHAAGRRGPRAAGARSPRPATSSATSRAPTCRRRAPTSSSPTASPATSRSSSSRASRRRCWARSASARDVLAAGQGRRAAAAPGAARASATRSTPRARAAPTCSACAGWASSRTAASRATASRRRSCSPPAASSGDVVGRTHAALEAAGALRRGVRRVRRGGYALPTAMTREEVFALIQAHLADELELDPARIDESTRFKEDLEADSLDLYTLVQELEDTYGVKMTDEQAARILTVGAGRRLRPRPRARRRGLSRWSSSRDLLEELPEDLHSQVFTHASWTERRVGLLRAPGLPRRQRAGPRHHDAPVPAPGGRALRRRAADEDPRAGRLGPACREVAERLGRARAAARRRARGRRARGERWSRPSACWPRSPRRSSAPATCTSATSATAEAVVEAFQPEIEDALDQPGRLQVDAAGAPGAARRVVDYEVTAEHGPPHERTFEVVGVVGGDEVGRGRGPLEEARRAGGRAARRSTRCIRRDAAG